MKENSMPDQEEAWTEATYLLLRRKKEKGIEVLYQRYGRRLYHYAITSWQFNEDVAWEMVYATLYKVVEKIEQYEFSSEKKFGSFLFTIFCNFLRKHYRDQKKREEKLSFSTFSEAGFELSYGNHTFATEKKVQEKLTSASLEAHWNEKAPKNEKLLLLEEALGQMKEWEKMLLLLRSQNMPYTEIAAYLNKPANQLKVYYQRAKKKLMQLIESKISIEET